MGIRRRLLLGLEDTQGEKRPDSLIVHLLQNRLLGADNLPGCTDLLDLDYEPPAGGSWSLRNESLICCQESASWASRLPNYLLGLSCWPDLFLVHMIEIIPEDHPTLSMDAIHVSKRHKHQGRAD